MKINSKLAHPGTLRLWAFGLLMGVLNVHAQPVSPGSGIARSPMAAASTVTPAQPATGPAPTAIAPRWGDGVLEREFLIKLRTFLENDPFDFKAFEAAFGVPLKADPTDGPHPGGSWGMAELRRVLPFGKTFNDRSVGGVRWSFDSSRNTAYVRMEFVKVAFGDHEKLHQPCLTSDMFTEAFAPPQWTRGYDILRYSDGLPVYGAPLFTATSESGVDVRFLLHVTGCIPDLYIIFDQLPPHPGAARRTP